MGPSEVCRGERMGTKEEVQRAVFRKVQDFAQAGATPQGGGG